jgi:hypothetical protein
MAAPEETTARPEPTRQTTRDLIEGERRMRECGELYFEMEIRLKPYPKFALIRAAEAACRQRGIAGPDRVCSRGRRPVVCFYCMNFPDFPRGFDSLPDVPTVQAAAGDQAISANIPAAPAPEDADQDLIGLFHPGEDDATGLNILFDEDRYFPELWL